MPSLLLCSATVIEIKSFLEWHRTNEFGDREVDILITGIGLTAATYHLTRQLSLRRYDMVLQAGVAGSLNDKLKPAEVVVVERETIADQSVVELGRLKTLFDLELVPRDKFPFSNGWVVNNNADLLKSANLRMVKGITVNQITTDEKIIGFYRKEFDADVESMEGAALHYVCVSESVPFIQFRSISNQVGERDKKNWNMTESVDNLNKSLKDFISRIYP